MKTESAFPCGDQSQLVSPEPGLTKREYFALHLYAAMVSNARTNPYYYSGREAVRHADALIEALNDD